MKFSKKPLVVLAILLVALSLAGCRQRGGGGASTSGKIELSYYKLFDDEDVINPLIKEYEQAHSNVKITYKKFTDVDEYEEMIINELAEGEGPDIFELKNTWVPRHMKKVTPLNSEVLTPKVYEDTFVSVAAKDFIQVDPKDGVAKIYAVPLSVDTLAVYYNKNHFDRFLPEDGKPAMSWEGIKEQAYKLRREGEDGELLRSGISLGRADNIENSADILYALIQQNGADLYNSGYKKAAFAGDKGVDALDLYTSFAQSDMKNYSWNGTIVSPESEFKEVEAFLTGKTTMMVGYAGMYDDFEVMLKNLKAQGNSVMDFSDIKVSGLPQIAEAEASFSTYASYFGETVSRTSLYPNTAWDFIQFMASKKSAQQYMEKSKLPTSRRDLIDEQKRDPIYGVFVGQLGFAKSIPVYHDRKFKEFLGQAITDVVDNDVPAGQAMSNAQKLVNAILPDGGIYPAVDKSVEK